MTFSLVTGCTWIFAGATRYSHVFIFWLRCNLIHLSYAWWGSPRLSCDICHQSTRVGNSYLLTYLRR
jgi:hypothetical protein